MDHRLQLKYVTICYCTYSKNESVIKFFYLCHYYSSIVVIINFNRFLPCLAIAVFGLAPELLKDFGLISFSSSSFWSDLASEINNTFLI